MWQYNFGFLGAFCSTHCYVFLSPAIGDLATDSLLVPWCLPITLVLMAPSPSLPKHAPWGASAQAWETVAFFRPDQGMHMRSLAQLCPWTTSWPLLVLTFMNIACTAPPGLHRIPRTETLSAFPDPLTGSGLCGHSCSSLVTIAAGWGPPWTVWTTAPQLGWHINLLFLSNIDMHPSLAMLPNCSESKSFLRRASVFQIRQTGTSCQHPTNHHRQQFFGKLETISFQYF